ncbi:hypothetical protein HaLaN_28227 [Haematococcus lacustris]|uniref:Uncharacterized protein n=1 Tax=Haematococcus lacustris TaxID=44745 RepID=A0A6A0AA81_HAELA|nr:hypothetical protein HaLaN_28227 [Haematococcus lacustris]
MPSTCVQSFTAQQPPHSGVLGGVGWEGWASRGCAWGGGEGKGLEVVVRLNEVGSCNDGCNGCNTVEDTVEEGGCNPVIP